MKTAVTKFFPLALLFLSSPLMAQDNTGSSNSLGLALLAAVVLIAFFVLVQVADNLLRIQAKKVGPGADPDATSIFPSVRSLFRKRLPKYVGDAAVTDLREGYDIRLEGAATPKIDGRIISENSD